MIFEEEIARGGFGRVEKVRMPDGTFLAKKIYSPLHPPSSKQEADKLQARFAREVKVQSSIASKSFISVLHSDLDATEPWYLMPLADRNFQQEIEIGRANGVAPQTGLADILNALEELHQLGFVHRDLKPQNILLHDGVWKLTDFGLVLPPYTSTTKLTSMDSNWGTAAYCAPEQAIDFRGATPAVDIYAFGCILHDIFSTSPRIPYQRHSAPGAIGAVIEKCTEQKPEKRFKNIQALRGTLLTLLASSPTISASPKASEWVESLKQLAAWDLDKAYSFVRFLSQSDSTNDYYVVFSALDEDALLFFHNFDPDIWKFIAIEYSGWVESTSFPFEYCDVLAKRLEYIFDRGDFECKGAAILAAAELAKSHNRWYVMGYVVKMCGPHLEENEAQRIAIEIRAADAQHNFVRCVEAIGKTVLAYHPKIHAILT